MEKRYRVMARKGKEDAWQSFTGDRVTTMERMEKHCRVSLKGMAYQFGIFCYEKIYVADRYRYVGKWILKKIFNFTKTQEGWV